MQKAYRIQKLSHDFIRNSKNVWDGIPPIAIDCFPWDQNGYRPAAEARLCYTETGFHLFFKAFEPEIRATYRNRNDPVYKDSCVEFFFQPNPGMDERYLNFEMNPLGTLLIGLGKDRNGREYIPGTPAETFGIEASVIKHGIEAYDGFWTVEYSIPFSFIETFFGALDWVSGKRLTGNFYKCGDDAPLPHYGCWNPIRADAPDFHRPECFGELYLTPAGQGC